MLVWGVKMSNYQIKIKKFLRKEGENTKNEIWAEITDEKTCTKMNKLIWWQDGHGAYHDGTTKLPIHLRGIVDNAWIQQKRNL